MLYIVTFLIAVANSVALESPAFQWQNRPQLIAFTFEGSLIKAKDSLELLSQFSNGHLACSAFIPATWFANDCTSDLLALQSHHIEIGAFSDDDDQSRSNINCLRANTTVNGLRTGDISNSTSSEFHYTMFESPSFMWPFIESNIVRVPFTNPTSVALVAENYQSVRTPVVISLSSMLQTIGPDVTMVILKQIMSLDEIVAVTTGQLSQLTKAKSASEAESIVNLCRNVPSGQVALTNSTSMGNSTTSAPANLNRTPIPLQSLPQGTSLPAPIQSIPNDTGNGIIKSTIVPPVFVTQNVSAISNNNVSSIVKTSTSSDNGMSTNTTGNNNSLTTTVPISSGPDISSVGSNISSIAGTSILPGNPSAEPRKATGLTPVPTAQATASNVTASTGFTLAPTIVGKEPASNPKPDNSTGSSGNNSSSSTGYVPYVIGIGGGVCAMAVAIVYKVFKREDRFPPVITNGYVFESEDRGIYDLEAYNDSVRANSEESREKSSSYVHSELESVSTKS